MPTVVNTNEKLSKPTTYEYVLPLCCCLWLRSRHVLSFTVLHGVVRGLALSTTKGHLHEEQQQLKANKLHSYAVLLPLLHVVKEGKVARNDGFGTGSLDLLRRQKVSTPAQRLGLLYDHSWTASLAIP